MHRRWLLLIPIDERDHDHERIALAGRLGAITLFSEVTRMHIMIFSIPLVDLKTTATLRSAKEFPCKNGTTLLN